MYFYKISVLFHILRIIIFIPFLTLSLYRSLTTIIDCNVCKIPSLEPHWWNTESFRCMKYHNVHFQSWPTISLLSENKWQFDCIWFVNFSILSNGKRNTVQPHAPMGNFPVVTIQPTYPGLLDLYVSFNLTFAHVLRTLCHFSSREVNNSTSAEMGWNLFGYHANFLKTTYPLQKEPPSFEANDQHN